MEWMLGGKNQGRDYAAWNLHLRPIVHLTKSYQKTGNAGRLSFITWLYKGVSHMAAVAEE